MLSFPFQNRIESSKNFLSCSLQAVSPYVSVHEKKFPLIVFILNLISTFVPAMGLAIKCPVKGLYGMIAVRC